MLALVASWEVQASIEVVPYIINWCSTGFNDCTYTTDIAAAQKMVADRNTLGDAQTINMIVNNCDGSGYCSFSWKRLIDGVVTYSFNLQLFSLRVCPTPVINPSIPYIIDSLDHITFVCYRAAQNTLTITLSGGTSVEPWHKKADADHKKANLQYTATVMDTSKQPAQPAPNVEVTITTDVTQDSGGHVHVDGRHKGKLAIPSDPIKDGKETITGSTDINGVYSFVFGSEEASGTHTLTAKCSTGCEAPATATVKVEIKGLSLLDGDPLSYTLNGETTTHPGSHYFSAAAMTKIINLAHKYSHDPAFNKQLLIINDSSLIKGGVFDLGQDWTYEDNGHQGHRIGVVVDVNNYRDGPNQKFKKFAKDCCEIDAVWEGPDVTSTPHYHLRLLGKDQ